jgi:hypothetical protein
MKNNQKFRFLQLGGFEQPLISQASDVENLDKLDPKLWVALSCPIDSVDFNQDFLNYLDYDNDGRIRVPEILATVSWLKDALKSTEICFKSEAELKLEDINQDSQIGKDLFTTAKFILEQFGKANSQEITWNEVGQARSLLLEQPFNGDGVISNNTLPEEWFTDWLKVAISVVGAEVGGDSREGIDKVKFADFLIKLKSYQEWLKCAPAAPLKDKLEEGYNIYHQVEAKIDDYFARCALLAYDDRAKINLDPPLAIYEKLASEDLSQKNELLLNLPLSLTKAEKKLPLLREINPLWKELILDFRSLVVKPLIGDLEELSFSDWLIIKDRLNEYSAWQSSNPVPLLSSYDEKQILELSDQLKLEKISQALVKEAEVATQAQSIDDLTKLIIIKNNLVTFLRNFVSFENFYRLSERAIFQAGTLYIDSRSCDLCIRVSDIEGHSKVANVGGIYLIYCVCTGKNSADVFNIVAAVTAGDSVNLKVGRRGIFYDALNKDWDAQIVKIVEFPISLKEAFWLPYRQIGNFINEQLEKFASAREKQVIADATKGIDRAKNEVGKTAEPSAFDVGKFAGIFAAIGLAIGAIGTALASVVAGFMGLPLWKMPLVFLGIILTVSGPSVFLAWLRLRARNIAPLLDASGWAINARAKLNIAFGEKLTACRELPEGSNRLLVDPYAKKSKFKLYLIIFLLISIAIGVFYFRNDIKYKKWVKQLEQTQVAATK